MINNYLIAQFKNYFPYIPTSEQASALEKIAAFLVATTSETPTVFLLKGYAGTGKTSLVGALVKTLDALRQNVVLLAPTGRAAKVFAAYAEHPAYTIHKKIYRQRTFGGEGGGAFSLQPNLTPHTLYIVDEASMIANEGLSGSMFGSGRLLDDLMTFIYTGVGCRLLLMGDTAQLPPVGEEESPALTADKLRSYGLNVIEMNLTEVVRQAQDSGILYNATRLRQTIADNRCNVIPHIRLQGFADVRTLSARDWLETLSECYDADGMDETVVVCRSNKQANAYNNAIRNYILGREEELERGDMLMIVKNNYFWSEQQKDIDFIANGDIAVVRRIRRGHSLYGFRFQDVVLSFPDYDNQETDARLLLDTLQSPSPALSRDDNERLFSGVCEDYAEINPKSERIKRIKEDPYFNALQVKYAYAVTCHKAQGGQWKNVFLDQGFMTEEHLTPNYYRWLYTAFTRATGTLYLINFPNT
jgi:exodeoxyribonuclease-5